MYNIDVVINEHDSIDLGDTVILSDPCYERDTWCMIKDVKIKQGKYQTYTIRDNEFKVIDAVICIHTDFSGGIKNDLNLKDWSIINGEIGVDSGKAGIFDDSIYPILKYIGKLENEVLNIKSDEFAEFYEECCYTSSSADRAGVLLNHMGIVSSSGFGDGGYTAFKLEINNEIVGLIIYYGGLNWYGNDRYSDDYDSSLNNIVNITSNNLNITYINKIDELFESPPKNMDLSYRNNIIDEERLKAKLRRDRSLLIKNMLEKIEVTTDV